MIGGLEDTPVRYVRRRRSTTTTNDVNQWRPLRLWFRFRRHLLRHHRRGFGRHPVRDATASLLRDEGVTASEVKLPRTSRTRFVFPSNTLPLLLASRKSLDLCKPVSCLFSCGSDCDPLETHCWLMQPTGCGWMEGAQLRNARVTCAPIILYSNALSDFRFTQGGCFRRFVR